jgi:hypothetical protein
MIDRSGTRRAGTAGWRTVARHDFDGVNELDATLASALGDGSELDGSPLYATVDAERAERFLSSVDGDDASVVFSVEGRTVRVLADGTIEVRTTGGATSSTAGDSADSADG